MCSMKSSFFLYPISLAIIVSLLSLPIHPLEAQVIQEAEKQMSQGSANAITFEAEECVAKVAEDLWETRVKSYGSKAKKNKSANEWVLENVSIVGIGGVKPVTVYVQFNGSGKTTTGAFWIFTSEGNVSSERNADEFERARSMVEDFIHDAQRESLYEELEVEEKNLEKLRDDLEKIEKNHYKYVGLINDCEATILEMRENIAQNEIDQDVVMEALEGITAAEGGEDAKKKMKKELSKLQKDHDKYHKEIEKCEKKIRDSHDDIVSNETAFDQQKAKIRSQREVLRQILERMVTIGQPEA